MTNLVFMLEEPSAEALLKGLLPRLLSSSFSCRFIVFEGKQDLEKNLIRRMRLYRVPDSLFVVIRDQDAADCTMVKRKLVTLCESAGKPQSLVRIACRELESWYLADLIAVEKGLRIKGVAGLQEKRKYRSPDYLSKPSLELIRLTKGNYQKISGSRCIGPWLDLDNKRSHSFFAFIQGMKSLIDSVRPKKT